MQGKQFMPWVRALALCVGLAGALIFGAALMASLLAPGWLERVGQQALRAEVQKRVGEQIDALDQHLVVRLATRMQAGQTERIRRAQQLLHDQVPARLAQVMGEMADLDCPCRQRLQNWLEGSLLADVASAQRMQERLTQLIRTQYMHTAAQLHREWRIFTGANALVFALLAVATWVRPRASWHLLPAAVLLVLAAGVTAWLYLFHQNWLHTIVFNDYVGWAYFAYLGAAFALLADVALNRARVTTTVLRHVLEAAGSSLSVSPC